jgi:PAS domain S-box-containing protein
VIRSKLLFAEQLPIVIGRSFMASSRIETNLERRKQSRIEKACKTLLEPKYQELRMAADILESIDDYVSAFDKDWKFVYVNKTTANAFGLEPKELIGKNLWETFPNFVGTIIETNYRDAMTKREVKRFEWETIYARTGFREFTVFPSAGGITVYGVDITERKQLQQRLQEYAKNLEKLVEERTKQLRDKERLATIGQTAGMVGHDIRNPLQAIAGDLYLVDNDTASLPEGETKKSLQESVNSIQGNLLYIAKIIEDLQDYAKTQIPNFERIAIDKVIEEVMQLVPISSNLVVVIDIEKDFPTIVADFSMLKRALTNLVNNAVQAMPEGGQLTIKAYHKDNQIFIVVEDNGVGIPEKIKSKLFDPMFTTKAKGQGLGLAVVKRLVEAQGGTISFESQEGKGTKFIIEMPEKK